MMPTIIVRTLDAHYILRVILPRAASFPWRYVVWPDRYCSIALPVYLYRRLLDIVVIA